LSTAAALQSHTVQPSRLRREGELSWRWLVAGLVALLAAVLVGLAVGPAGIPPGALLGDMLARLPFASAEGGQLSSLQSGVLWELRVPRVLLGALVGATLATAGGAYQAVFRNPLADPYLLGAAAGAGLGATVAIVYVGVVPLPLAAFVGATAAAGGAYMLGRSVGDGRGTATLILAGVAMAAFLTALQTLLMQQNTDDVRAIYSWLMGRLSTSGWREVLLVLPYAVLSVAVILAHRRLLDVLRVGDEEAAGLGIRVARLRLLVVAAATLGTAAAVAVSGLIGFVGIIVPHAVRLLAGSSYRVVLPLSALFGAAFLVLADVIARTALAPAELPIGVVTACIGAPFFVVILRTSRAVTT
jgi:iron complex transport system permease protein